MRKIHRLISCLWIVGVLIVVASGCALRPPIRFGFAGEITGNGSDLGISARNGVVLGVEYINANGGVDGRTLEVVIKDDQGKTEVAQQVDQELIDEKVVAIVGHITSSQSVAGLSVTEPAGMVMLSPISSSLALTGIDDLFFRVCADNMREIRVLSRYFMDAGQTQVAVVYDTENEAFSLPYAQAVSAHMATLGGSVLELVPYEPHSSAKVDDIVSHLSGLNPDAILIVSSAVGTALLTQHIRLVNSQVPLYAVDWAFSDVLIQTGGRSVEGISLMASFDVNSQAPALLAFRQQYTDKFGYEPNYAAMQSYEAVLVLAEALKTTHGQAEGLPDALRGIHDFPGLVSTLSIDPYGDVVRPVYMFRVEQGRLVTVGEFDE